MLVFAILALATLGLSSAAFAHGLDVSASLFLPTDGDTMRDAGESSGFVELQITEEIGEICWDIEFEGIEESVDLIVRSAPENASGEQGEQPPLVMVATVISGSADCVFRDIEATTEITLNVDAHIVELISMSNGDVLLRGRLRKPLAPGFEATDAREPESDHSTLPSASSMPWKRVVAVAFGTAACVVALASLIQKRPAKTS